MWGLVETLCGICLASWRFALRLGPPRYVQTPKAALVESGGETLEASIRAALVPQKNKATYKWWPFLSLPLFQQGEGVRSG